MNWYNYVGSDPVNFTDPLGLKDGEIVITGTKAKQVCPSNSICDQELLAQLIQDGGLGEDDWGLRVLAKAKKPKKPPQKDKSISHCAFVASKAHIGQITVDVLSAVPAGKVAALAGKSLSASTHFVVSAAQFHGAFGSGTLSAVNGDLNGVGLAAAGYGTVIADFVKDSGSFIPILGTAIAAASVANDIFGSEEYKACRKGE